jgi:hypothetical protein
MIPEDRIQFVSPSEQAAQLHVAELLRARTPAQHHQKNPNEKSRALFSLVPTCGTLPTRKFPQKYFQNLSKISQTASWFIRAS